MGGTPLARPVAGMAATPKGNGYWLVGSDGGVFTFGDAPYLGSTGGIALAQPVVGIATTPTGRGYWLVGSDGGIFSFGDAPYLGSGAGAFRKSAVSVISRTERELLQIGTDGSVLPFGDGLFCGGVADLDLHGEIVGASLRPLVVGA